MNPYRNKVKAIAVTREQRDNRLAVVSVFVFGVFLNAIGLALVAMVGGHWHPH